MFKTICFLIFLFTTQLSAMTHDPILFTPDEKKPIIIENRILAKVNGKAISVIDIMKKMDMLFYRQFPEYTDSSVARLQFYQANWESVLQDLIDKELIIADADENKLPMSNGDVRQEMENLFGPNIINNLDKVGLTYDEAWRMVRNDIIMRRMLYLKAHSKALKQVTPEVIRQAYEEYAQANIRPDIWIYRVISIRDKDSSKAKNAADQAYRLLVKEKTPVANLSEKLGALEMSTKLSISEEYRHTNAEVSDAFKEPLSKLQAGTFSPPISHTSRADNSIVFRIFYLKEKIQGGKIPFSEVANQMKEKLLNEAAMVETESYILKLHKHFDLQATQLDELKAEGFEPFKM